MYGISGDDEHHPIHASEMGSAPLPLDTDVSLLVDEAELAQREAAVPNLIAEERVGMGREFFGALRKQMTGAEQGACCLFVEE